MVSFKGKLREIDLRRYVILPHFIFCPTIWLMGLFERYNNTENYAKDKNEKRVRVGYVSTLKLYGSVNKKMITRRLALYRNRIGRVII